MADITQLLCTFCTNEDLAVTLETIKQSYKTVADTVYILENVDSETSLCCTYNVEQQLKAVVFESSSVTTISLHRKKSTNTLYTINALNLLIAELNDGVVDKSFRIPWDNYRNTILVTAYGQLKKVNTKLQKIVTLTEL